jgi:hypothetical protein
MMGLSEQKWWKKAFSKKELRLKEEILKDLEAMEEFLDDVDKDAQEIKKLLLSLEELEKERKIAKESIIAVNLESQAKVLDTLIERYEFFQNDVDINGLRIKKIASMFLKNAEKAGMKDLVKSKNQDMRWRFLW